MISAIMKESNPGNELQPANIPLSSSLIYTSGEIRNSLSSIISLISAIYSENSNSQDHLSDTGYELLDQVHKSSAYALNLVEKLGIFMQLREGRFCLDACWINLPDLMRDTYQMVDVTRSNQNVEFLLDIAEFLPSSFYCDPLRLRQILVNLLNNALKFTKSGYVRLGAYVDNNKMVIFVDDSGSGIPRDYQDCIFEPFRQAKGHQERGFGLGLALCRSFARLHGGEIYLESELGVGSSFAVILPLL